MNNLDLPKLRPLWGTSVGPDRGRVKLMRSAPMAGPGYVGDNAIEIELAMPTHVLEHDRTACHVT